MQQVILSSETDFEGWRDAARRLAGQGVSPGDIHWTCEGGDADLFAAGGAVQSEPSKSEAQIRVPKEFVDMAKRVVCHRDPARFAWLYQLLFDLQRTRAALTDPLNDAARWVKGADKQIRRDVHKMHAFVRFRKVGERDGREVFMSWFEPDNRIVGLTAPFFMRRFTGMDWTILTPDACASWDGKMLSFAEGADRSQMPGEDRIEDQWRTYYASIFNPARLKVGAMLSEMPAKYWKNLPEAELIPDLIKQSTQRTGALLSAPASAANIRASRMSNFFAEDEAAPINSLQDAARAASRCNRCPIHECASQTIFGEGPETARLMIIGEQPGDSEDIAGKPFVGPAGQLFDKALGEANIDRRKAYVTNAVKHFKFTPRGKRRMHQKPNAGEIDTCRFWLDLERKFVAPDIIVTMGTTALRGVFGKAVALKELRGALTELDKETRVIATVHPSYLLRLPDRGRAEEEYARFVDDLSRARSLVPQSAA